MADYVCSKMGCGNKAKFGMFSFGTKICTVCGSLMVKEGSARLKTSSGAMIEPHLNGPAIKLPEPPLHGKPIGSRGRAASGSPPSIDLASIQKAVDAHSIRAKTNASVDRRLVFKMTPPGGSDYDFDMPIKYQCWKTGLSKQDLEFTIKIPVKVYSGADALQYWIDKGYAQDAFSKTVHGGQLPGVQGATFTDDVRRMWSAKANKCWGRAGVIWTPSNGAALKYALKFEFVVVDDLADAAAGVACVTTTGQARTVNPSGTIDAVRWGVSDVDPNTLGPICHEVGHLIGNPDEYFTIEYDGRTHNWGSGYQQGMGIMNNPDNPPHIRNFKPLALELATAFNIPLAEAEIVQNLAAPFESKKHRLSDHIWG